MTKLNDNSGMNLMEKIEKGGLTYIKKEQSYIKLSTIFPIYSLFIIIMTLVFIILGALFIKQGQHPPMPDFTIEQVIIMSIIILIPACIFIALFIFSLFQLIFLKKWKKKVQEYDKLKYLYSDENIEVLKGKKKSEYQRKTTLTNLFYDIINHLEKIRVIFIIINILSFFYLWWSFRIFALIMHFLVKESAPFFPFFFYINVSGAIILIFYLIYMWYHFKRWYKKLKSLKNYEKKIAKELDL
ncbi:MAG: hypothetical protein ACTSRI_00750 [Promethearchaeota archaeon]